MLKHKLIEGRLKAQYAGDPSMRISHECLCQWIYAKPQRALDLRQYLARGRKRRTRKKGRKAKGPRIPMRVPIADRPEAVGSRKGFGHFESDTVVGAAPSRRCMNTQVERRSRRLFARLVDDKSASATARAEYEIFKDIPPAARVDRTWDNGTAAYEKRGIAVNVPEWKIGNCIQCNQCAYVCPHAVIRPFLATEEEAAASGVEWKQGLGETKEYKFRIQISPMDCTGCSNCVDVCPAKDKALVMRPLEEQMPQQKNWDYITKNIGYKQVVDKTKSVKNLQFAQPLFEFSGACAGCGETPYIKAISQLFGDKMMVANATGCTSIYSGSAPSTPYCTNAAGQGPAWANSLFEDNAEFGLGMHVGVEKLRDRVQETMEKAIANCTKCSEELKAVMKEWIENRGSSAKSAEVTARLIPLLEACGCDYCKEILEHRDWLVKKSQWIIGGDGWGYDIGYGGVDHVLATGQDVNILVVDTEVYSNTGGQSSKSTPVGAVAKFASSGKRIRKKDLGAMAMTYGYVYVAQVSIGASQQQLFNVLKEAEAYPGPSLVIAYAPCINHGIKGGMTRTQTVGKEAVACGYWHLWHYNPLLEEQGKNPFVLDSKEPDWSKFREFLLKEVRYTSLQKSFPAEADELFAAAEENAKWRYNGYKRLAQMEY